MPAFSKHPRERYKEKVARRGVYSKVIIREHLYSRCVLGSEVHPEDAFKKEFTEEMGGCSEGN
jgi:hypothetical protein